MSKLPISETRRTLPIALLRAREVVMDRFRPLLRDIDLTEAQWRVLRVVREHPGIAPTRLAEQAVILAPSLTRVLKTLDERGLITVEKPALDRRRAAVSLTAQGEKLLSDASKHSARIYAEIADTLGAQQMDDLLDALERLMDRLGPQDDR